MPSVSQARAWILPFPASSMASDSKNSVLRPPRPQAALIHHAPFALTIRCFAARDQRDRCFPGMLVLADLFHQRCENFCDIARLAGNGVTQYHSGNSLRCADIPPPLAANHAQSRSRGFRRALEAYRLVWGFVSFPLAPCQQRVHYGCGCVNIVAPDNCERIQNMLWDQARMGRRRYGWGHPRSHRR